MAFSLVLPTDLRRAGWKVKIRDKERLEPPHVTLLFKTSAWRVDLRSGEFLDVGASWRDVDPDVRTAVEAAWDELRAAWDSIYPDNPVGQRG